MQLLVTSGSDNTSYELTGEQKKILQAMAAAKNPCGSSGSHPFDPADRSSLLSLSAFQNV